MSNLSLGITCSLLPRVLASPCKGWKGALRSCAGVVYESDKEDNYESEESDESNEVSTEMCQMTPALFKFFSAATFKSIRYASEHVTIEKSWVEHK